MEVPVLVTNAHLMWWRSKREPAWVSKIQSKVKPSAPSVHDLINAQVRYPHALLVAKDDTELHNTLHLIKLRSGKILTVYGRRLGPGFGEYACLSDDQCRTWDVANEIKLAGHFDGDLGYPASVELPGGDLLTVYYQKLNQGEKCSLLYTRWQLPS